jgi:hypothetical protein
MMHLRGKKSPMYKRNSFKKRRKKRRKHSPPKKDFSFKPMSFID